MYLIKTILRAEIIDLWKIILIIHVPWQQWDLSGIFISIIRLGIKNEFTYLYFADLIRQVALVWIYIFIILCLKWLVLVNLLVFLFATFFTAIGLWIFWLLDFNGVIAVQECVLRICIYWTIDLFWVIYVLNFKIVVCWRRFAWLRFCLQIFYKFKVIFLHHGNFVAAFRCFFFNICKNFFILF